MRATRLEQMDNSSFAEHSYIHKHLTITYLERNQIKIGNCYVFQEEFFETSEVQNSIKYSTIVKGNKL